MTARGQASRSGQAILLVGTLAIAATTAACSSKEVDLCPDGVVRISIFNTYADHTPADLQEVDELDDVGFVCDSILLGHDAALERQSFDLEELGQRRITAFVLVGADGDEHVVWMFGLTGADAGTTAIVLDNGDSYHLPNPGMNPYLYADASPVERSDVPLPWE